MKNVKMILPIAAFVFALVGAFASNLSTSALPTYIAPAEQNEPCNQRDVVVCDLVPNFPCRIEISGIQYDVYDDKLGTQCINILRHSESSAD